jgi:hypothetical protein
VNEFLQAQNGLKGPGSSGWWEQVIPELTDEQDFGSYGRRPLSWHLSSCDQHRAGQLGF